MVFLVMFRFPCGAHSHEAEWFTRLETNTLSTGDCLTPFLKKNCPDLVRNMRTMSGLSKPGPGYPGRLCHGCVSPSPDTHHVPDMHHTIYETPPFQQHTVTF
eukprot:3827215-Prymnesium_polylepis.2